MVNKELEKQFINNGMEKELFLLNELGMDVRSLDLNNELSGHEMRAMDLINILPYDHINELNQDNKDKFKDLNSNFYQDTGFLKEPIVIVKELDGQKDHPYQGKALTLNEATQINAPMTFMLHDTPNNYKTYTTDNNKDLNQFLYTRCPDAVMSNERTKLNNLDTFGALNQHKNEVMFKLPTSDMTKNSYLAINPQNYELELTINDEKIDMTKNLYKGISVLNDLSKEAENKDKQYLLQNAIEENKLRDIRNNIFNITNYKIEAIENHDLNSINSYNADIKSYAKNYLETYYVEEGKDITSRETETKAKDILVELGVAEDYATYLEDNNFVSYKDNILDFHIDENEKVSYDTTNNTFVNNTENYFCLTYGNFSEDSTLNIFDNPIELTKYLSQNIYDKDVIDNNAFVSIENKSQQEIESFISTVTTKDIQFMTNEPKEFYKDLGNIQPLQDKTNQKTLELD